MTDEQIQALIAKVEVRLAALEARAADAAATARTESVKVIAAAVVSVVTAVAGSRLVAPTPPPSEVVVQRSAFDRALDACRALQGSDAARADCIVKVVAQSTATAGR